MQRKHLPLFGLLAILFILACGIGTKPLDPMSMTLTPMSALIRETVTARAIEENGSGAELATAVVKATEQAAGIYATQTARAALNELMDWGRPGRILLCVLVDRGGRELPIQPDIVGRELALRVSVALAV